MRAGVPLSLVLRLGLPDSDAMVEFYRGRGDLSSLVDGHYALGVAVTAFSEDARRPLRWRLRRWWELRAEARAVERGP